MTILNIAQEPIEVVVHSEPSTLNIAQEMVDSVVHNQPSTLNIAQMMIDVIFVEFWGEGVLLSDRVNSLIIS